MNSEKFARQLVEEIIADRSTEAHVSFATTTAAAIPLSAGSKLYDEKVKHRVFSLHNDNQAQAAKQRRQRRMQKEKLTFVTGRAYRASKLYKLEGPCQYADFLPMHELWTQYLQRVMEQVRPGGEEWRSKLLKADYHGARFTVVRSRCPSFVGLSGIVIQELKNCFKLITKANQLKTVPKDGNVFQMEWRTGYTFDGTQLVGRAAERIVKKFKKP